MTNRPSLLERIRLAASPEGRKNQKGLALLDVLLGMAIFALIVVIAIQAIAAFRQSAYLTGAKSDAKQVAVGVEAKLTDNPGFDLSTVPTPTGDAATVKGVLENVNLTKNDLLLNFTPSTTNPDGYTFCVVHQTDGVTDAWAYYDSAQGAIVNDKSGKGDAPSSECS